MKRGPEGPLSVDICGLLAAAQAVNIGRHSADLILAQPPGQLPGHFALHHPAGIKNTAGIFQTGNGHACAPVVQQLDDLLLGQALQRLAHQGAGHIELLGQLLLAQAFTRRQSALQNGLVNGFVDAVCACDLPTCTLRGRR